MGHFDGIQIIGEASRNHIFHNQEDPGGDTFPQVHPGFAIRDQYV